jgi:hypothetical protein
VPRDHGIVVYNGSLFVVLIGISYLSKVLYRDLRLEAILDIYLDLASSFLYVRYPVNAHISYHSTPFLCRNSILFL